MLLLQAPVAARRPVACKAGLTARAQELYDDLAADNSRVLSIDNIVDGFYISPKFIDKVCFDGHMTVLCCTAPAVPQTRPCTVKKSDKYR